MKTNPPYPITVNNYFWFIKDTWSNSPASPPPPSPWPLRFWRMKYGLALSVIHNAPASNTSSGLTHIIPDFRGPLNTQESRRQLPDRSERNFGEFGVLKHRQRPESLLRFGDRSSVAVIKTASPELGHNVELLHKNSASSCSTVLLLWPLNKRFSRDSQQDVGCYAALRRIRLCFAPEQVTLFARPLSSIIRFTADQNEHRTLCACILWCRVRCRVCALKKDGWVIIPTGTLPSPLTPPLLPLSLHAEIQRAYVRVCDVTEGVAQRGRIVI